MSRRKQTKPRAIKRDASEDNEQDAVPLAKKIATGSARQSVDSTMTNDDERVMLPIKCDACQETCDNSEQFNQHRLYECPFLTEETGSDESRTSSFDESVNQLDTIPYGMGQTEEYPNPCSYCNKSFSNMALLLKHEQVHVELMPFRCSSCGKGFKHRRSLNRHSKLHTGERKYKCNQCESTFARSDHLKAHIRTHNNNNHHALAIDKIINLECQIKTHHIKHQLTCTKCSKEIESNNEFEEHSDAEVQRNKSKTEQCPHCTRICLGEESLRSHVKTEHKKTSDDDEEENQDKKSTNESSDDAIDCENSKKTRPSSAASVDQLKLERISPLPFTIQLSQFETSSFLDTYCHLCNANFNNRENYYAHVRCMHPPFKQTDQQHHHSLSLPSLIKPASMVHQREKLDEKLVVEFGLVERTVGCDKCKRSFDSMSAYLQHYSLQHSLQLIKCLQCQELFETMDHFYNHIERVHPSKTVETFKCKLCNATYKHRTDFIHHAQTVHTSSLSHRQCPLCSCMFDSLSELIEHLTFIHETNGDLLNLPCRPSSFNVLQFPCTFCSMKCNSRFELNQHLKHEHDDAERYEVKSDWHSNGKKSTTPSSSDIVCALCDLTFASEPLLLEHNKNVHRSPPPLSPSFKCIYCHALFTSRTQLDRHSRIHIASSGNNLKCNICDRHFTSVDILSEHKLSHCKATTSNICSYCHQSLMNETDYTRHLYEHHHHHHSKTLSKLFATSSGESAPPTIACIVCKQSLLNEREIELHAKFHLTGCLVKKSIPLFKEPLSTLAITCDQCHRISTTSRDFLLELPSFTVNCFRCIEQDLKSPGTRVVPEIDSNPFPLSCPKCRNDVQFDSIKTYQQHFAVVHQAKHSVEEYHCLKCNKIVGFREHILQHRSPKLPESSSSSFLIDMVAASPRCHSPPRVHYCYLCRTNFDTAIKMHIHLIEHQFLGRDYECNLCGHCSFDDAAQLYHHMVQHGARARLYPCRECDVYFMFSMHLVNHRYSHTNELSSSSLRTTTKSNGNAITSKCTVPAKSKHDKQPEQQDDDDDVSCRPFATRASTKGICRSVIVS